MRDKMIGLPILEKPWQLQESVGAEVELNELPQVTIELIETPLKFTNNHKLEQFVVKTDELTIRDNNGKVIGIGRLKRATTPEGYRFAWLEVIQIHKERLEEKKGGYGKAAYLELIKTMESLGTTLVSDTKLSRGAYKVWEWLVHNGFAKKLNEGILDETVENTGYSTAEYEAIRMSQLYTHLRAVIESKDPEKIIKSIRVMEKVNNGNRAYVQAIAEAVGRVWELRAGYDFKNEGRLFSGGHELSQSEKGYFLIPPRIEKGEVSLNNFFPNIDIDLSTIKSTTSRNGYDWYLIKEVEARTVADEKVQRILRDTNVFSPANIFHYIISNEMEIILRGKYLDEPNKIALLPNSTINGNPIYASYENRKVHLYSEEDALKSGKKIVVKIVRNDDYELVK